MKLPIFICDDEQLLLSTYERIIKNTIIINDLEMEVFLATTDISDILSYISKNQITDSIFFLDINLGSPINGLDVAQKIRQVNEFAQIVFITSHKELAFEILKRRISALDFIIKGDNEKIQITELLIERNQKFILNKNESKKFFRFNINQRSININFKNIYLIETSPSPHKIILIGDDIMYEFYGKLSDIEKQYPELKRVHKSYLINPENIISIDFKKREIFFPNETMCTFPLTKLKEIKEL